MGTYDHYATPSRPAPGTSPRPGPPGSAGSTTTAGSRLLDLYQRGKDKQWDAAKRIDWDLPVDPTT